MSTWVAQVSGARPVGTWPEAEGADVNSPFAATFLRDLPHLRRVVAGMGFAAADAEDILQDVYVEAAARPGEYRGSAAASAWLLRVTVNRCLAESRRRERFRRLAARIAHREGSTPAGDADPAARSDEIRRVREHLRRLDPVLTAVLVLRYYCDCNATQIAQILDLPAATVRSRLRTARLRLAAALTSRGPEP